ncbi:uncharacterized protein LOC132727031, partial [Ruditapes philippinarum]|uniref:uncharacterized protein LOC132727031 n=1 Tax=Ruditapes philippinarum TaxID=129788 RepID=UPI00295BDF1F
MPGPLERWLETFMCGQFADNFERYGYRTLQTVCQMQLPQLLSIGIPQKESEIILQNVQILRQSTAAVAQQQIQHGISSSYNNTLSHDPTSATSFQNRDVLQEHTTYMGSDSSCFNYGNQSSGLSGQFYNQGVAQSIDSMMSSAYRQQYQGSSFPQQISDGNQFSNMGIPSPSSSSASGASHRAFQGQVPGSPLMGQTNMHHSHPHLRNSGQNPQEVANNILHMAASSYPTNNTVQVPLSKNRSAPYHMPSRSPNYNSKIQDNQQLMCSDYNQGQFAYPSPPHQSQLHMQSRDSRLSPISPASASMMSSPHSHHSGRNVPSSSPCSMHSPNKGVVRSPGPNPQLINSPQRGQYQMMSPMNTSNQRLISSIPANQQLKVSVPSSLPQTFQQCYYGNMMNTSQYPNFQQPMSVQFSPSSISQPSTSGQLSNSPGNFPAHSPGGHSGHFSNISSPYTPGSGNYLSPGQPHNSPSVSQHMTDRSLASSPNLKQCNSPLQSLQKLCMLPEVQVVDPKTVVKEACVHSQGESLEEKLLENNSPLPVSSSAPLDTNFSSTFNELAPCNFESELTQSNSDRAAVSPNVKFQPKEVMLLKEAKNDLSSPQSQDTVQYFNVRSEIDDTKQYTLESVESIEDKSKENKNLDDSPKSDKTNSENIDSEKNLLKGDTDNKVVHGSSEDQTCAENFVGGSTNDHVESNLENKTSDNLKTDSVNNEGSFEGKQDSSQSKQTCDTGSEKGADTTENVQFNSADIDQGAKVQSKDVEMAFDSESSLSGNDTQLLVCKDVKKTYSKQEILKSFEISPRLRGDSTGSLSDERANSDYEYEDHIGCDDIETGFSDIDSKSNEMVEESVDDAKDLENDITNGSVLIDRVVITGPSWKKNSIKNSVCSRQKRRKNGHMKRERFIQSLSDSDDVPSPLGGDVVDGLEDPISVDNGDGTVTVRRSSHIRQRKTPVKYKDTSFFQGDFVLIDGQDEPKRKIVKKSISMNHNAKQNGVVKKSDKNYNSINSNDSPKLKINVKQKDKSYEDENVVKNLESTMKLLAKQEEKMSKSEQEKNSCSVNNIKVLTRGEDGTFKELKTVTIVKALPKDDLVRNSGSKSGLITQLPKSDSKHTPIQTATVMTRKSSKRECNIEKSESTNVKKKVSRKHINGVRADTINGETNERISSGSLSVNQNNEKINRTKKSKALSRNKDKSDEDIEVIEIDSDDSEGAGNNNGADIKVTKLRNEEKTVPKTNSITVGCSNAVTEDVKEGRGFMFSLVEDEVVDKHLIEGIQTDLKEKSEESENCIEPETSVKRLSKKSSSGSNNRGNNSSCRTKSSGKVVKRKYLSDDDPDFEVGSSKRQCKSNRIDKNTDNSASKKSKKKSDKWANFKGPKIIFEGMKQTPKHCVVINDPYEETASKKTKTVTQNMTRIEISQLPSDKSVLIPNNETTEIEAWSCALCGKHSSFKFLGDLFGPYTVETMSDDMLELSPKVRLGTKKKKAEDSGNKNGKSRRRSSSVTQEVGDWKEVWVHESCSVYSDGVFLIGSKIYGLQEAVRIASQTPCSVCNEMGAMIGCLNKGCQQKFHHACAQGAECYLDEENFS